MSEIPPQIPPKFESNYPRQGQVDMSYVRPPGVYFDAIGIACKMIQAGLVVYAVSTLMLFAIIAAGYGLVVLAMFSTMGLGDPRHPFQTRLSVVPLIALFFLGLMTMFGLLGLISVGVQHAKGQQPSIGDFFIPFRRFGTVLLTGLIWGVPGFIFYALIFASMDARTFGNLSPVFLVFLLLFYLVIFLLSGPAYMSLTRAVFGDVGPIPAVTESFQRLKWNGLLFSLLIFITSILAALGEFLCCVGLLVTYPILTNTIALHYLYYFPPSQEPKPRWATETPS